MFGWGLVLFSPAPGEPGARRAAVSVVSLCSPAPHASLLPEKALSSLSKKHRVPWEKGGS